MELIAKQAALGTVSNRTLWSVLSIDKLVTWQHLSNERTGHHVVLPIDQSAAPPHSLMEQMKEADSGHPAGHTLLLLICAKRLQTEKYCLLVVHYTETSKI